MISMILLISLLSTAKLAESSPFAFLTQIQGSHKGDHSNEIHLLKNYLHNFGYLSSINHSLDNPNHYEYDDEFDDDLEAAIKTYQLNYNLNITGTLDSNTVSTMTTPRCGVADIINGTTRMESGKINYRHGSRPHFHTVSHYSFFPGCPKWRPSKYHLTYGFLRGTPIQAMAPVARAFRRWARKSHFTFERAADNVLPDVRIGFHSGRFGKGKEFDGAGGLLAHAFAPEDGRLYFDGNEKWSVGAVTGSYDLETVALHEIGHVLGLSHSSFRGAIMFPTIYSGRTKGLHSDDVRGIRALYNF